MTTGKPNDCLFCKEIRDAGILDAVRACDYHRLYHNEFNFAVMEILGMDAVKEIHARITPIVDAKMKEREN